MFDQTRWFLDDTGELRIDPEEGGGVEPERFVGVRRVIFSRSGTSWTLDGDGIVRRRRSGRIGVVRGLPRVIDLVDAGLPCALAVDGGVWCWGAGASRWRASDQAPVRVEGLPSASQLVAVQGLGCAVADGGVWCWSTPAVDAPPFRPRAVALQWPTRAQRIAVRGWTLCAVDEGASVQCARVTQREGVPPFLDGAPRTVNGVENARDVAVMDGGACALLASGRLRCWGRNASAAPAGGTLYSADFLGVTGLPPASSVALSRGTVCAVTRAREAWCWGDNRSRLVDPSRVDRSTPRRVEGLPDVVQLGIGYEHACALDVRGAVWCWGDRGRSGEGPAPVMLEGSGGMSALAVGDHGACATDFRGIVRCWNTRESVMVSMRVPAGSPLWEVTPMGMGFCAREGAEGILCWNLPSRESEWRLEQRQQPGLVSLLPSGGRTFLAADRLVYDWIPPNEPYRHGQVSAEGLPGYLQLPPNGLRLAVTTWGDSCTVFQGGTVRCDARMIDASGQRGVVGAAMGHHSICVIHEDGRVSCAGMNDRGQLGDGAPDPEVPVDAVVTPGEW
jgi:hypothetical protein